MEIIVTSAQQGFFSLVLFYLLAIKEPNYVNFVTRRYFDVISDQIYLLV